MRNESKPVGAEHFQNRVVGPTCISYCALAPTNNGIGHLEMNSIMDCSIVPLLPTRHGALISRSPNGLLRLCKRTENKRANPLSAEVAAM